MMKSRLIIMAAFHLIFVAGCYNSASVEAYRQRADDYFAAGRYAESIVAYLNVLHAQPTNRPAQRNLGIAYYQTRDLDRAYPLLARAARWNDEDLEVKIKLASLLAAAGSPQEAEPIARSALDQAPDHDEALLVWANAVLQNGRPDDALQVLLAARDQLSQNGRYFLTLGAVQAALGDYDATLDAFNRAVELTPENADAYLARGELFMNARRVDEATADFQRADALAPGATVPALRFAMHLKSIGDTAAARVRLDRMLIRSPDFIAARYERAVLEAEAGHLEQARQDVEEILAVQPDHLPAGMLRARLLLQAGKLNEATEAQRKLALRFPRSIPAGLAAARLLARTGDTGDALHHLDALLRFHHGLPEAMLLWAELSISRGDYPPALARLGSLTGADEDKATRSRALLMTGLAHRRHGNSFAAVTAYEELADLLPADPQPRYLAGLAHREAGRTDAAAASWRAALGVDPVHFPALQGLVMLRLEQGAHQAADELVTDKLVQHDDVAGLHYLRAAVATARNAIPDAELALQRAIELQSDFTAAYRDLGRLYVRTGRVDEALLKLQAALDADPSDISALMMMATLLQEAGREEEAMTHYEKAIDHHPGFVAALNNLAYLYAVRGEQPERAMQLAQRARELAPRDPAVADTLGMIAIQRGQYRWAHNLLRECEVPLAGDPEVMHHLAQASLALGQESEARQYFAKALATLRAFPGRAHAEARAAVLDLPLEAVDESHAGLIAAWLEHTPSEPPVLVRQAALEQSRGKWEAALKLHRQALTIWPEYLPALTEMTRIFLKQDQREAALDTAARARALQPSSPELTFLLGQAAYQSGDYPWARSLFAESLNAQPEDAEFRFHHALAAMMSGRVEEAHASAIQALQLTRPAEAGAARRRALVDRLEWYATGAAPAHGADRIDDAWLKPVDDLARARFAGDDAPRIYRDLIDAYPAWPLPRRDLVSWSIARGDMDDEMLQLARDTRAKMPGNALANRNHAIALAMHGPPRQAAFYLQDYLVEAPGDQEAASWLKIIETSTAP